MLTAAHVNDTNKVCVCVCVLEQFTDSIWHTCDVFLTNTNLHRLHNWLFCIFFAWLRVFSILSWHPPLDFFFPPVPCKKKKRKDNMCEDHYLSRPLALRGHRSSARHRQAACSWVRLSSCSPGHTCSLDVWRLILSTQHVALASAKEFS